MDIQVANPFAAFMAGREAREAERARAQQAEREGLQAQLLQQRIQSQPAEMADAEKLRQLEIQGAEQGIATQNDAKKQRAYQQIGSLAQQVLKTDNPRAAVQALTTNPAYASVFSAAGFDPSKIDINSPSFEQDLQAWASMGPQVSPEAQFNRETQLQANAAAREDRSAEAQAQREFLAQQNALGRQNQADIASQRVQATQSKLRPIPPAIAKGIVENRQQLAKIDRALAAVDPTKNPNATPDAFGYKNYLPDALVQRYVDPSGVDARAQVADIGSLVINDRSGAAVSAGEFPRLRPFIPAATDDAATVKKKLENLRANVAAIQEDMESSYSEATGYQPLPGAGGGRGASGGWDDKPGGSPKAYTHRSGAKVEILD